MFGCKAYTKVMGPLKKLDERSRELTFVDCAPRDIDWDSKKRKLITARDVKFEKLNPKDSSKTEQKRTRLTLRNEEAEQKQEHEREEEEPEEIENAEEPEEPENEKIINQQQEDDKDSSRTAGKRELIGNSEKIR